VFNFFSCPLPLSAGLVVLLTAVMATRERVRELAIMHAPRASSHLLRQLQRVELRGVSVARAIFMIAVLACWVRVMAYFHRIRHSGGGATS
jgi:predicted lysophospholipase L1 biosynthesis ABC-type transport system permease subunit